MIRELKNRNGKITGITDDGLSFEAIMKNREVEHVSFDDREIGETAYFWRDGEELVYDDILDARIDTVQSVIELLPLL